MNTNFSKLLALIFPLMILQKSWSQTNTEVAMERVTPPSPEAAALGKYGTVPMGLFTGTPNISIELYTLKTKTLQLPITINYSSNGLKVNEVPTRVGMSWVLSAGGVVTRTIYDKPDDKYARAGAPPSTNFAANSTTIDPNLTTWIENIDVNHQDTQFDEYSFSFNGYSGKFIIDLSNNVVMLPYSNIKVEVNLTSSTWNFRITTPDGIKYYFGEGANESTLIGSGSCSREDAFGAKSAWYLTRVENPNDPSDYITLTYNSTTYAFTSHITHTITYWDPTNVCGVNVNPVTGEDQACGCVSPCIFGTPASSLSLGTDKFCISQNIYQGVYLNEITSSLYGKIHFTYITKPGVNSGNDYLLSSMQVYQNNNGTILLKSMNLNYTMVNPLPGTANIYYQTNPGTEPNSPRPFLTSLQELDRNGSIIGVHSFEYNDMNNLPPRLSFAQDYFGYYNGTSNFNSLIPQPEQYASMLPSGKTADRNMNYSFAIKGILTKVTFPTGGYTQMVWEGNSPQQTPTSLASSGGGLRIKQQIVYDPVALQSTTTNYQYAGMKIPFSPRYYNSVVSKKRKFLGPGTCLHCANCDNVVANYIQFSSNSSVNLYGRGSSLVYYTSVTESTGSNFILGGIEHTYSYEDYPSFDVLRGNVIRNAVVPMYNWKNGLETNQNIFKMVGATKVYLKKTTNTYSDDSRVNQSFTQYVIRNNGYSTADPYTTNLFGYWVQLDFFDVMSYPLSTKWTYKSSSQDITYDQDGNNPVTTTISYTYDNLLNAMLSKTESQNSKGLAVRNVKKYPGDEATITNLNATETDAITKLKARNNFSPVLENEQYVNNILQSRIHLGYKDWGSIVLKPEVLKSEMISGSMESRVQFTQYDANGNLLAQNKTGDVSNSYIWDYKSTLPIAQVTNSSQANIAYTSFEADGKGYWSFTGITTLDATAPTGNKCYTLGTSITRNGLSATTTYIVSYWKKSGTVSVNATSAVTGRTSNGWTYYEHKVTNPSGGLITVSGTNGIIDELRLYPAGSVQMTTYTYDPLIGMTSQAGPDNRIIYFEYDGLQRLTLVRDQDRNILKKICYNFSGQTENCSIFYNQTASGTYTRSCTVPNIGSMETYTVPANLYSASTLAAANQLAYNDVYANGQAYANSKGTCTAGVAVTGYNSRTGTNYSVKFSTTINGNIYNFTFPLPNGTTVQTLGYVLPGYTYTVQFIPGMTNGNPTFFVGPYSHGGSITWTFSGVSVTGSIMAYMN